MREKKQDTAEEQQQPAGQPANEATATVDLAAADPADKQPQDQRHQEMTELKKMVTELEAQAQQDKEALLRCRADFENFRRRQQKKLDDAHRFGTQNLINDLLEPLDNFEKVLSLLHDDSCSEALKTGIESVALQLNNLLTSKWGLEKIKSLDCSYDPNLHQAVSFEESSSYSEQKVLEEFRSGYLLHGRVIRESLVKVGKPAAVPSGEESGTA